MNIDEIRNKLYQTLNKNISLNCKDVFIFGAGNTTSLYTSCIINENIDPICFIDNNPQKHNSILKIGQSEKKVIYPGEAKAYVTRKPVILICSSDPNTCYDIKTELSEGEMKGWEIYHIDEYVFSKNAQKLMDVFDMLEDDCSKRVYANMIMARIGAEVQDQDYISSKQYFSVPEFAVRNPSEVFVDCGAYVGDTIEQYLNIKSGTFSKIYAFEPNNRNYNALCCRIERLKREWAVDDDRIQAVQAGVGDQSTKMTMISSEGSGTAELGASFNSADNTAGDEIQIYSLDDYFKDERITFIKADIESFEEKMINGAIKTIKRDKPIMAVCIYHNASDMYRIPLFIKKINPSYKIKVNQHYCKISETVLYAY